MYPRQYDFYGEYKYDISNSAENPFDDYPQPKIKIIEKECRIFYIIKIKIK